MSRRILRRLFVRLIAPFTRRGDETRLRDELEAHLALQTEANIGAGLTPDEARRQAILKFGAVEAVKEQYRDERSVPLLDNLIRDVRYALRALKHNPGFTAVAVLTLAIGIGGTATMFAAVYGVLFRPLPYPAEERLVGLWELHPGANAPLKNDLLSRPTYRAWAQRSTTLDSIAAYMATEQSLARGSVVERVRGAVVTPSLFEVLQISPMRGRSFLSSDAAADAESVAILVDAFWRERFGSDPSVVGSTVRLNDREHVIVGIISGELGFPNKDIQVYTPLIVPEVDTSGRAVGILTAVGRLKPHVTVAQAEAEGTALARAVDRPFANLVFGEGQAVQVRVRSLIDQQTRSVRSALVVLSMGVAFFLLIACANFANLLLSREAARIREFAIRASLGASRARLSGQVITESLVISMIGGVAGLFVGWALVTLLPTLAPASFPRVDQIRVDYWFALFAGFTAVNCGIVSGIWPVMRIFRDLPGAAPAGLRGGIVSDVKIGRALVVGEAALAVVLLVGATLLARSFVALLRVDAGYEPAGVLTADVSVVAGPDRQRRMAQLADVLVNRLRAVSGVQAVGLGSMAPFGSVLNSAGFALPGTLNATGQPVVARAFQAVITPGYAEALGLRLREGRFFVETDTAAGTIPMIVNKTFASTYLTDGKPVTGRVFRGMFPKILGRNDAVVTIVGVVDDVLPDRLDDRAQPQIYLPMGVGFSTGAGATLVVKAFGNPAHLAPTVRNVLRELEPGAALAHVAPLSAKRMDSAGEPRFATFVMSLIAGLALGLSITGLYGVLSYNVTQRTRELGIRGALGAEKRDLYALVLRQGLTVTAIGIAIGLAGSAVMTRGMTGLLFGVQPFDLVAFLLPTVVLMMVAWVACLIPARRAARVDPLVALRFE